MSTATVKRSLPEITADVQSIMHAIEEGGEISPAIEAFVASLENEAGDKLDSYHYGIMRLRAKAAARQAEADLYYAEADEHDKACKSITAGADRMEDAIKQYLETIGSTKLVTPRGRVFRIQTNGTAPVLYDDQLPDPRTLPADITRCDINRAEVRKRLLAGETYAWARIGPKGTHLRIEVSKDDKRPGRERESGE